jgi:zinc transport system substrate-binding protein
VKLGIIPITVAAIVAAVLGSGCGQSVGDSDGRISVVAGFYPLAEAAERAGGDRVNVQNLTPPGSEPHDLELTTRQVDELLDADLILYLGGGFQPAVEEAVAGRGAAAVDLLEGKILRPAGEASEDGEEDHGNASDPHVWLDPVIMAEMVDQVASALTEADPAARATFEANARAYAREIDALDQEFHRGLRDCRRRILVTSHAAFAYLAARYGLRQESVSGISPEAEPDPRRLEDLVQLVRNEGVTTVFTETLVSPRVADTLAREAGVSTAVLNPLEGLTEREEAAGEDYLSVMRENLRALEQGLGCD